MHQAPDGRWYYAHVSGATQWQPPHASATAPPPPPPPQQPPGYPGGHATYPAHNAPHAPHAQQAAYPQAYPPARPHRPAGASASASAARPRPHKVSPYVFDRPVEFKLKESVFSLSGDSFSIKRTDTKEAVFRVKGNAFSFRDSKTIMDLKENPIYKMQESIVSLRGRMQILDAATRAPVITLRKKGFITGFGTGTIQAWTGASDDGAPTYEIKGDFFKKDFVIREIATGASVAQIRRKSFGLSNIVFEKDSYVIRVEPGRDAALIVFFVVAVDEQYRDDGNRKGYQSFGSLGSFF